MACGVMGLTPGKEEVIPVGVNKNLLMSGFNLQNLFEDNEAHKGYTKRIA